MKNWVERTLFYHKIIVLESGGNDFYVDQKKLEGAILSVFSTFDGEDLYPSKEEKAAALCFNIISDHAFSDGNKRVGVHIMLLFLKTEGTKINYNSKEVEDIGLCVANGTLKYKDVLDWILKHKCDK